MAHWGLFCPKWPWFSTLNQTGPPHPHDQKLQYPWFVWIQSIGNPLPLCLPLHPSPHSSSVLLTPGPLSLWVYLLFVRTCLPCLMLWLSIDALHTTPELSGLKITMCLPHSFVGQESRDSWLVLAGLGDLLLAYSLCVLLFLSPPHLILQAFPTWLGVLTAWWFQVAGFLIWWLASPRASISRVGIPRAGIPRGRKWKCQLLRRGLESGTASLLPDCWSEQSHSCLGSGGGM